MNNLAILFTKGVSFERNTPFKTAKYNRAYGLFAKKGDSLGMKVYVSNYDAYKNAVLKQCWCYDKGWKKAENVQIDFVYSRFNKAVYHNHSKDKKAEKIKHSIIKDIGMLNHPVLEEFCWDKTLVKEFFPEHCPKTFLIGSKRGLKSVLPEIKTENIILKPRYGTLGSEIIVTGKTALPEKIKKNTIVQEFIDSSNGIKGIVNGMHDLRLIIINGKIDHAHIRIPKNGNMIANMAKGGKKIFIRNEQIPKKAVKIAKKVDRLLGQYHPRVYSIDFIFDKKQTPYIVECNSSPVISRYAYGKYKNSEFYDRMLSAIKEGIKIKVPEIYND